MRATSMMKKYQWRHRKHPTMNWRPAEKVRRRDGTLRNREDVWRGDLYERTPLEVEDLTATLESNIDNAEVGRAGKWLLLGLAKMYGHMQILALHSFRGCRTIRLHCTGFSLFINRHSRNRLHFRIIP